MKDALLNEVGGHWFHIHGDPYQERGVSDLIGCVNSRFISIEVKMPGETMTEYQKDFLDLITRHGGLGFSSDNVGHAVTTVKDWLNSRGGEGNSVKRKRRRKRAN